MESLHNQETSNTRIQCRARLLLFESLEPDGAKWNIEWKPKHKRRGTPLLAVMDENCTSCAGAPLCEPHCPVDGCINLLYEETPNGGLKPYRVWVDHDKCIGCQMCYSDDLTKVHRHKETGEIFLEYAGRYNDSSKRPLENDEVPKKFQLELIGAESEDRLDKKICPWDAIKMYEFEEGARLSSRFYDATKIGIVDGRYVVDPEKKKKLKKKLEKQQEECSLEENEIIRPRGRP